ncbi:PEPxxWA-CTERM sorting domain-containing protein [Sandaracinobacteroides sp. A072]|uniref:PEPxxWA-CTERM sorting domain-containing protein n=1 Tax=Sandaracinobacteroides sp. A072 TaxID=3461146 RepID=UPI0040419BFF
MGIASKLVAALAATVAITGNASAAIVGGAVTGGTAVADGGSFTIIPAPPEVGNDDLQTSDLIVFDELQGVTMSRNFTPNIGSQILKGARVSSHGIAFDPSLYRTVTGWVEFDRKVLGVVTGRVKLNNTHDLLGAPGTAYDIVAGAGGEANDIFTVDALNPYRLNISMQSNSPGDFVRVITAAVPEPSTWAMLIAGFAMIGMMRRRQRMGAVLD